MSNARTLASLIDDTNTRIKIPSGYGLDFADYGAEDSNSNTTVGNNLMDDYEEGTFQPSFDATVTSPTVNSYGLRDGFYIKIGKLVHINLRMRGDISSVGSGNAIISGIPFNIDSTNGSTNALSVGYYENWTTNGPTFAMGTTNTNNISLFRDNGASGTRITVSNYKTGNSSYNEVYIAGTYITN